MQAQPVKRSVASRVLPLVPTGLDYPATRQAAVTIPSRIARDHAATTHHTRLLIEIAAAGGDVDWVMLPTVKFLAATLSIHHSTVSKYLYELAASHYIEIKQVSRQLRYARIVLPGHALDWE